MVVNRAHNMGPIYYHTDPATFYRHLYVGHFVVPTSDTENAVVADADTRGVDLENSMGENDRKNHKEHVNSIIPGFVHPLLPFFRRAL